MTENPKISIIMPVYNAEKYLEKAVFSVISQSYKNWELIIVNDGSEDNSWKIIEQYAKQDERIVVLSNPCSLGAGLSRNLAVDCAKGEYLMFLDADDIYNPELCLKVAEVVDAHHPDIIEWPFVLCDENEENIKAADWLPERKNGFIDLKNYWFLYATSLWCRAFKKDFIIENKIKNSNVKSGEDNNFVVPAFLKAKSFYFFDLPEAYLYRQVKKSLSHNAQKNINFQIHEIIWNLIQKDLIRLNVYNEKFFNLMKFVSAMWSFSFTPLGSRQNYNYLKNMIRDWTLTKDDFEKFNLSQYKQYCKIKKHPYWLCWVKGKIVSFFNLLNRK